MTAKRFHVLPLLFAFACGGDEKGPYTDADGIRRDAKGCWANPEQIWNEYHLRYCSSACGLIEEGMEEECLEGNLSLQEEVRDRWCVDPCAVDDCFKLWDHFLETCSEDDALATQAQCSEGPEAVYWDANNPDRPWSQSCAGW